MIENSLISPAPPGWIGLTWRPITRENLTALGDLVAACHRVDGGLSFIHDPEYLLEEYFPDRPGTVIGAFDMDSRLAAVAAVHLNRRGDTARAVVVGQVRPDMRHRGIGTYLMRWSEEQAQTLLSGEPTGKSVLQVATESLTEPANQLYVSFGYEPVFESLVMQRDLNQPLPAGSLPPEITLTTWHPNLAKQFYAAYEQAFRHRPGFPGWSEAEWISAVLANDFQPEWSFLARRNGVPVGFVIGNIDLSTDPPGGHVWQMGVIPSQRRRGIATALLNESMRQMQTAGTNRAFLTVNLNNPGAIAAYQRMGFITVGRRARYERVVGS